MLFCAPALLTALLYGSAHADVRLASQPKNKFLVANRRGSKPFDSEYAFYFEPSTFNYNGLERQKRRNYDNFLRSNIDNQQDNRNFETEIGEDHLPFRTLRSSSTDLTGMLMEPFRAAGRVNFQVSTLPLDWNRTLTAYLDNGNCGPFGNDHNRDNFCPGDRQRRICDHEVNVATSVCSSGKAYLEHYQGSPNGGWSVNINNCIYRWVALYSCVVQEDQSGLVSYWDSGRCGPYGNDHNRAWCPGRPAECKSSVDVPTSVCSSGTAYLQNFHGSGHCCSSIEINGCKYAYFAKYSCEQQPIPTRMDALSFTVGVEHLVPLRWNNPHASELEVNIWLPGNKVVVPIRKPACSGEGYQDNVFSFIIPPDFNQLATKVPDFRGCNVQGDCVLQVYAHSVESRTFTIGIPITIIGSNATVVNPAQNNDQIQPATRDPGTDLSLLKRDTCLSSGDPSVHIPNAVPRHAKLISDVYNHAYQNSDFSPYSGQQHEEISRNLQAACILQMVPGNRGELGKSLLRNNETRLLKRTRSRVNSLIKRYESIANSLINLVGFRMKTTGLVAPHPPRPTTPGRRRRASGQELENCFRCLEVGSVNKRRLETNTYIPSFPFSDELKSCAPLFTPEDYANIISSTGVVQIYIGILETVKQSFAELASYGFGYLGPVVKSTTTTMADATQFRKIDANGNTDKGQYAAQKAKDAAAAAAAAAGTPTTIAPIIFHEEYVAPAALVAMMQDNTAEEIVFPATVQGPVNLETEEQMHGREGDLPCESDISLSTSCGIYFATDDDPNAIATMDDRTNDTNVTSTGGPAASTSSGTIGTTSAPLDPDLIDGCGRNYFARQALAVATVAAVTYL